MEEHRVALDRPRGRGRALADADEVLALGELHQLSRGGLCLVGQNCLLGRVPNRPYIRRLPGCKQAELLPAPLPQPGRRARPVHRLQPARDPIEPDQQLLVPARMATGAATVVAEQVGNAHPRPSSARRGNARRNVTPPTTNAPNAATSTTSSDTPVTAPT